MGLEVRWAIAGEWRDLSQNNASHLFSLSLLDFFFSVFEVRF